MHLRRLSHASKHTTHHFSGGKASSLSVTTNGLISASTSASRHISITTVFIRAIEKVPKGWYSKQNSFPYSLLSQNFSGGSLRHFGRSTTLSLLCLHEEYPSQPLSTLPLRHPFFKSQSSHLYLFPCEVSLNLTLPLYLNLVLQSQSQSRSLCTQFLPFPFFFPRDRRLQHRVAYLNDRFHAIPNLACRLTIL